MRVLSAAARCLPPRAAAVSIIVGLGLLQGLVAGASDGDRAWLGISMQPGPGVVEVTEVIPDTPAEDAGLLAGDDIARVAGVTVRDPAALVTVIGRHAIGDEVVVEVRRRGKPLALPVVLERFPSPEELVRMRLVDKPAPPLLAQVVHGEAPARVEDMAGKVVVLELWATWCTACTRTHDALSSFANRNIGEDLVVLGVSAEDATAVRRFLARSSVSFAVGLVSESVIAAYHATAVPQIVVIDRRGIVRHVGIGADAADEALAMAQRLLRRKP